MTGICRRALGSVENHVSFQANPVMEWLPAIIESAANDPVRTMVGDGFRSNPRARSYRRRDAGDQNGDGRRAPRPCSGRSASRLRSSRTPSAMLEGTCDARFSQAGRDGLRLGGRGAFLDDPGGRTYGGGSCPSYLSMMRSYFTPC